MAIHHHAHSTEELCEELDVIAMRLDMLEAHCPGCRCNEEVEADIAPIEEPPAADHGEELVEELIEALDENTEALEELAEEVESEHESEHELGGEESASVEEIETEEAQEEEQASAEEDDEPRRRARAGPRFGG